MQHALQAQGFQPGKGARESSVVIGLYLALLGSHWTDVIADGVMAVMITGVSTFFISLIILEFENKKKNSICFNCLGD